MLDSTNFFPIIFFIFTADRPDPSRTTNVAVVVFYDYANHCLNDRHLVTSQDAGSIVAGAASKSPTR